MTTYFVPRGFRIGAVHAGLKRNPNKPDVALFVADEPAVAAGVYTQNLVFAAPVALDRSRTPTENFRVLVVNSGNANACTGERGEQDARRMTELAAAAVGTEESSALVMSTGIIGHFLPMEKIEAGIARVAADLGDDESHLLLGLRGLMTTDKTQKIACREIELDGATVRIAGLAKGAGMIGPDMATLLAVVLTDAKLSSEQAQTALRSATNESFNCISVDGHTSTNDTALLLASGKASGEALSPAGLAKFGEALTELCQELAKMIPDDGEGATHLIEMQVEGCKDQDDAVRIARTVAASPLVKCAVAGGDPNWGRIVSAAGYAGVPFDPKKVRLEINGLAIFDAGGPLAFDAKAVSTSIKENRLTRLRLVFGEGSATARFWASDLNEEYVRFNSEYST